MTYKEVAAMIGSLGVPNAYDHFDEGTATAPPFICFFYPGSNDFVADNENYQAIRPLTIELYTDEKDFALEARVEAMLIANGLPFSRSESYIEIERLYEVIYNTEVLING